MTSSDGTLSRIGGVSARKWPSRCRWRAFSKSATPSGVMPTNSQGAKSSSSHSLLRPRGRRPPIPRAARYAVPTETIALSNGGIQVSA
jgi:hypothetical protein